MTAPSSAGVLYVVATPIGNLEDLTFRALRILREVDLIAAEDTRRTAKLLAHYEIRKPTISLREHNEVREVGRLLDRLSKGDRIALVSDAGTPAIADPGARLVRAAHEHDIKVVPIPGPSAVTAALSVAGLAVSEFTFMGFPPAGGSERRAWFERLAVEARPTVLFEAPHRIHRTLADVTLVSVDRPIYLFREISKINEELVIKQIPSIVDVKSKGEFVLIVGPTATRTRPSAGDEKAGADIFGRLANSNLFSDDEMVRIVAATGRISERAATKLIKKNKILVKRQRDSLA